MPITAKVVGDTVHPDVPSARITSIEYTAPRFLLAEINTHGLLAKSAASSRAIPVHKRIQMVLDDPFVPHAFGKNKPGMQAGGSLEEELANDARDEWWSASRMAARAAGVLERKGVHKQHANRLLEPYAYVTGILTATEWDNFFKLRLHPEAQPEFQELAAQMKAAIDGSEPFTSWAHLPYIQRESGREVLPHDFRVSAARCARVSYKTHDGRETSINEDIALCDKLITSGHWSPFDHAATVDGTFWIDTNKHMWMAPSQHGRYWGWIPYRSQVETDAKYVSRRSSFDAF